MVGFSPRVGGPPVKCARLEVPAVTGGPAEGRRVCRPIRSAGRPVGRRSRTWSARCTGGALTLVRRAARGLGLLDL